jgi:phosphate transport system substrate-binding protein
VIFPLGTGWKGSDGVAGYVRATRGAIGYVDVGFALKNNLPMASVQNRAGKFIKPTPQSLTAAVAGLKDLPDDLRFSAVNAPGDDAFPMVGCTFAVVYVKQPGAKAKALREFLTWVTHDGQKEVSAQHFGPLPKELIERIDRKLALIQGN